MFKYYVYAKYAYYHTGHFDNIGVTVGLVVLENSFRISQLFLM